MLTLHDIQKIVNAVFEESKMNEQFKALAYSNVEEAIRIVIECKLSKELKARYDRSLIYYKKITSNHL